MFHYRPKNAFFGDPVPFYWDGTYHLFYLKAHLEGDLPGGQHDWYHTASKDLIKWKDYPVTLKLGAPGQPDDAAIATGSVVEKDGTFHIFYCGFGWKDKAHGAIRETICHATSPDLVHWTKDPANPIIKPDKKYYAGTAWRDPFVIWNPKKAEYWMLVTASTKNHPFRRQGCVALLTSPDLKKWTVKPPFYAPDEHPCHECPDLFEFKGKWYLITSSWREAVFYRYLDTMESPVQTPMMDRFDGDLFYAAKTAGDDRRRILFGWLPNRKEPKDAAPFIWGGHMIMRELVQGEEGSLLVKCPDELLGAVGDGIKTSFAPVLGEVTQNVKSISLNRQSGFSCAIMEKTPANYFIKFTAVPRARYCGLYIRTNKKLDKGYALAFEGPHGKLTFKPVSFNPHIHRPIPERPFALIESKPVDVKMFINGTVVDVFINDEIALCARIYDHKTGALAFFAEDGRVEFNNINLHKI